MPYLQKHLGGIPSKINIIFWCCQNMYDYKTQKKINKTKIQMELSKHRHEQHKKDEIAIPTKRKMNR